MNEKQEAQSRLAPLFGEEGLAGEVRSVSQAEQRVAEAARLGFRRCILPQGCIKQIDPSLAQSIELLGVRNVRQAVDAAGR